MKNVKVIVLENGQVEVVGINKDGSTSKVEYNVVAVEGLKEFGVRAMKAGVAKQFEATKVVAAVKQEQPAQPEQKPAVNVKPGNEGRVKEVVYTKGNQFTNVKRYGTRAVGFEIAGKGECVVGFAKDRNVFLEAYNGVTKEVTRSEVLRRLSKYKGVDARNVVVAIKELKPASLVADYCEACKCEVTHRVKDFSLRHYKKVLCRTCQPNDGGNKVAERSEGANHQAPKQSASDMAPCGNCGRHIPAVLKYCGDCVKETTEQERLAYWEETCECGGYKERAYESCEDCRENTWAETDGMQQGLFDSSDVCTECCTNEAGPYGVCEPCIGKLNAEMMAEEPSVEEATEVAVDLERLTVKELSQMAKSKGLSTRYMKRKKDFIQLIETGVNHLVVAEEGASEASANSSEQNVDGEGAQALDADTLAGLGL